MTALRLPVCVLLALASCGCATQGAAWISASRFDYREYGDTEVAVMPVMLHRLIETSEFPTKEMQHALADQLGVLEIKKTELVTVDEAASIPFPYTPQRLIEYGQKHKRDAVVAATIVRMDARPTVRQWSFTGNITFVDVNKPDRRWTIAKTWDMNGDTDGFSAKIQIATGLLDDFIQLRRILPRTGITGFLPGDAVVINKGPILNLDVVDKLVDAESNVTQTFNIDPDAQPGTNLALIDISAIDDEGIKSLRIVNKNASFSTYVWGGPPPEKAAQNVLQQAQPKINYEDPHFLAERVLVKIAPGRNDITAYAMNGKDEPSEGFVRLRVEVNKDSPAVMVVIAPSASGEAQGGSRPRLSPVAVTQLQALIAAGATTLPSGARAIPYVEEQATRENIFRNIMHDWGGPGAGVRRVIAFVGRAEMYGGRPYLMLQGAEPDYPEIGSLSVNEFVELMRLGISRASLDVCTNASEPAEITAAIREYIDVRIDLEITAGCTNAIGAGFVDLAEDELFDD